MHPWRYGVRGWPSTRRWDLPLHDAEILAETFRERVVRTEDALEGPKAFMEKRAPNWQCR